MTNQDYSIFKELWESVASLYGKKIVDNASLLAFTALASFPFNEVSDSMMRLLKTSKFMPSVADVIQEIMGGTPEDRAIMAWNSVKEALKRYGSHASIKSPDPCLIYALDAIGGLDKIFWAHVSERGRDERSMRDDFCQYYSVAARRGVTSGDVPDHIQGLDENRAAVRGLPWNPDDIREVIPANRRKSNEIQAQAKNMGYISS